MISRSSLRQKVQITQKNAKKPPAANRRGLAALSWNSAAVAALFGRYAWRTPPTAGSKRPVRGFGRTSSPIRDVSGVGGGSGDSAASNAAANVALTAALERATGLIGPVGSSLLTLLWRSTIPGDVTPDTVEFIRHAQTVDG